ncbi:unnamed protein product, partial [Effrenium voratum]
VSPKRSESELRHLSDEPTQGDADVLAVLQDNLKDHSTDDLVRDAESLLKEVKDE